MLELVRASKGDAICAGLILLGALLLASTSQPARSSDATPAEPAEVVLLEGMSLDNALGAFQWQGDRLIFRAAGGESFTVLENLNLQRIADKLQLEQQTLTWNVTGTITEYRGGRYLLISRAQARRTSPAHARLPAADRNQR